MTRINLVSPSTLVREHLTAEYHELPRIFTTVLKHQTAGKYPSDFDIPKLYKTGKGHVTFFYNKCRWLKARHIKLRHEMIKRGYTVNHKDFVDIQNMASGQINDEWYNWYDPTPEEIYINMQRITGNYFKSKTEK